ncbi:hypothetical protein [Streptomyces varsoviensis]|uniref:ESAT-6-like protein n=1 Tax=Streptomyces varsoviensis TaxID=67373 RepID=A0ABR5J655_9ACTN|nr:hypothetical protein [Streptomyces varsoviensis]KOG88952.1 hypothetical protein ADK38_16925 [Streptomyces varsoviensis]
MSVHIQKAGLENAVTRMQRAHSEMVDAVNWLEQNFSTLRETLNGEARTQWDAFHVELKQAKDKLDQDYLQAMVVLQQMYDRQMQGDRQGAKAIASLH